MGLLSIFKRPARPAPGTAANEPIDAVQRARVVARQRLIGAVILVIVGVIGFPLVFETQPRPIPVDIPIEVPSKENASPLVMPARNPPTAPAPAPAGSATAGREAAAAGARPGSAPAPSGRDDVITETTADAGREWPAPPSAAVTAAKPSARTADKPGAAKPSAAAATRVPEARGADAERARELLAGNTPADPKPSATGTGRYILQVGAFADASAAHDTRLKAEKLGLKTYTQVASTPAGNRIRVRVGPYASRDEADKALAKARAAGLSAVVLTL